LAPQVKQEITERLEQFRHKRAQRFPRPDLLTNDEKGEEVPRPDLNQKILAFEDFAAERIQPIIVEPISAERVILEPPKAAPPEWKKGGWRELQHQPQQQPPERDSRPAVLPSAALKAEEPRNGQALSSEAEFQDESSYDEASPYPVAPIALRGIAGALDCGVALVAVGAFFSTFYVMGGGLHFNQKAGAGLTLAAAAVVAFYFFLYIAYASETPGLQWVGLRVLDYDGGPPRPGQRLTRAVGMLLSAAAIGLGYLWALADEEGLTWHDRMSKTFVVLDPSFDKRLRRSMSPAPSVDRQRHP
jgi:uncharacterized RDD family membrane protein YckC